MKVALATILKQEGYIDEVSVDERNIAVKLKYIDGKSAIAGLKRISTPGRRVYVNSREIPKVQNGQAFASFPLQVAFLMVNTALERKWAENFYAKSGRCKMSRIGKLPIEVPAGVEIKFGTDVVEVKRPEGKA